MYRATILRMTVRVLSSVLCIFCAACVGPSDEPAGEASSAGDAVSRTFLYMDFEDGDIPGWRFEGYFSRSPLETRHLWSDGGPGSRGSMRCSVLDGDSSGAITFDLTANGYDPIPVGPETRIAWSWKPSFEEKGNGCWFFAWCSNPGLDVLFPVRAVHWRRSTHDVVGAYYDPENFFSIHAEPLYSYLCMRSDPAICDEFSIEKIVIGISMTEGGEVEIDDIWIGEGEPPDSVFTRRSDPSASPGPYDKITGVSFGFLDHDWTPDRIETYHDRVEICLDSPASGGGSARPGNHGRSGVTEEAAVPGRPVCTTSTATACRTSCCITTTSGGTRCTGTSWTGAGSGRYRGCTGRWSAEGRRSTARRPPTSTATAGSTSSS